MNEGAVIGALIASTCISIGGASLIFQQLIWRREHMSRLRLWIGCIGLGWPLYILIGYANAVLYLLPIVAVICLGCVYRKATHGYTDGRLDREKAEDAAKFFMDIGVIIAIGIAMLLLDILKCIPGFNGSGLEVPLGLALTFLLLIGYGTLIRPLSRRWTKE